ncbi:MAG TPA: M20/M25/M40 family metallo-hydrolase [Vitreimonas sp.]|uniref:M20/M25/M40 family metallo-hydrolase n=1 Tax=Vitreimonas sp. TaxID=3069702 RepID=UPI002D4136E2|nr:M20/M25/M40 family metallo-hydrolase [Vitreimonas sp.]HYD86227.1 M20/M25/M40 family metallo-hydrolase [Vitreimonas sp.]
MTDTPPQPARRPFPYALFILALLFAALMSAGALVEPPPLRAANAAHQFDAAAARARLGRILGDESPHPVDSAAQDVVRARLLTEIRALGFTPEVREQFVCRGEGLRIECAMVRNVLFSAGPERGPAILAATHYDGVPAGPGASDAGVGVAAWLEIARMLRDEALERRVIFLISDGEEQALLGAQAFVQSGGMEEVGALVNLEARGTRGPAVFFESNQPNADAAAAFARAPRGMANSVMADVYALLPNSTDVTALTRPGLDVVNIALLEGLEHYHTPQDSLASADVASLQHMGDSALATVRAFAGGPDRGDATPLVYTDIASRLFVRAPAWAAQGALGVSVLIAAFAFWRAEMQGRWRAFAAPAAVLLIAGLSAAAAGFALDALRPGGTYWFAMPAWTRAWCALAALAALPLALMATRAPRNGELIGAAAMLWFALLGFVASFLLPGISILFAIPALAYALFAAIGFFWTPARTVGAIAAALLTLLVWAPALYLTELALGFEFPFASAALMALAAMTWLGLLVRGQGETRWRGAAAVLGAGMIAAAIGAALAPAATSARPAPLNLNYFVDVDEGRARVLAGSAARPLPAPIAAAADFQPERVLPGDRLPSWAAPAALAPAPAPTLTDIAVAEAGGERIVRATLAMNGAYRASLRIPRAAAPRSASVAGVSAGFGERDGAGEFVSLACQGRACDGAAIEIVLSGDGDTGEWFIIGQTPGAPARPAAPIRAARPAETTPIQFGDTVVTLARVRPLE